MNTGNEYSCGAEIILKDLCFQIMAAVFEVHNVLGAGFLESVYEKALLNELKDRGLKVEAQKPVVVSYKGEEVGLYYVDILVENKVLLELKAVEKLAPIHEAQVLNYLRATGLKLGVLINFGKERVEHRRLIL